MKKGSVGIMITVLAFSVFIIAGTMVFNSEIQERDSYIRELKLQNNNINKLTQVNYDLISNKINSIEYDCPDCYVKNYCYEPEESEFDLILKDNAKDHPYIINYYDCTEFAKEGARRLNNLGFKAKDKLINIDCKTWTDDWDFLESEYGYTEELCRESRGGHMIIQLDKLYIEATTGEVIMPYDYERYGLN